MRISSIYCVIVLSAALCGCRTARLEKATDEFTYREPIPPSEFQRTTFHANPVDSRMAPVPQQQKGEIRLTLRDAVAQSLASSKVVRVLESDGVALSSATLFDPEIAAAQARKADATFDPELELGYEGSRISDPPSSFFGPGIPAGTRRDEGNFYARVAKSWPTGAKTSVGFDAPLSYLFFPDGTSGAFNPAYESGFFVDARQPLLRGAGQETNLAPIRIAFFRVDQETWQVKQAALEQVRSVEEAYWNLQAAVVAQQSIATIIPLADEAVRIQQIRLENELITQADLARAQVQLAEFQQRQSRADLDVQTSELRLRNVLAVPLEFSDHVIPIDQPLQELIPLNIQDSIKLAWVHRPELIQQRIDIEIRGNELVVAENGVMPRLDVFAQYRTGGLSDRLDASLDQALGFGYTSWTLGGSYSVPLGNRSPQAARDEALLRVARERAVLQQMEENIQFRIAENIAAIGATWEQYSLARKRAAETLKWLEVSRVRFSYPPPADSTSQDWLTVLLVDYQQALEAHLDAVTDAADLLAEYNSLNARLEETQGTLLMRRQVWLADEQPREINFETPVPPVTASQLEVSAGHTPVARQDYPVRGRYPQLNNLSN